MAASVPAKKPRARPELDDAKLVTLLDQGIKGSDCFENDLEDDRRSVMLEYFRGEMTDVPAEKGRSKAVMKIMADTIEALLPGLVRVFDGTDRIVLYGPMSPDDVESSAQATDYVNHVWLHETDGYLALLTAIHDALTVRNGILKAFWDTSEEYEVVTMRGLDEAQLVFLHENPDITFVAGSEYQEFVPGPEGVYAPVTLYDVRIRRVKSRGRLVVEGVPPENFGLSKGAKSIDRARLVWEKWRKTRSELLEDGYDPAKVEELQAYDEGSDEPTTEAEMARADRQETGAHTEESLDRSTDEIEGYECYVLVDMDGDGVAERWRVVKAGNTILDKEPWPDDLPYVDLVPMIVPHRWQGQSIGDNTMDLQRISTALLRGMLDNIYAVNRPQREVVEENIINPDEVLSPEFGGVVRVTAAGSIVPLVTETETQHTEEKRDPWEPAQPMLKQILQDARGLYESGAGSGVYDGDVTAGLGSTSRAGISALQSAASGIEPAASGAQNFIEGTTANEGQNGITRGALDRLAGAGDADLTRFRSALGSVDDEPAAAEYLRGTARGDYLGNSNSYLNDLINQASQDAALQTSAQFSANGRYGSGAHARAVADATGRIGTEARAAEYGRERDRQFQAAQLLDSTDLARAGARISGEGALVGYDQANRAAADGRSGAIASIGQQGQALTASLIPQLEMVNKVRGDNANNLLLAGSLEDAAGQAELDAALARWQSGQDAPFKNLGLYQAVAQPIAGLGYQGESTTTRTIPQPGIGQQLLGGGLGVLSLLSKGLPFTSDERVKENVQKVGELPDGLGLYSYRMDEEHGGERQIGVLAQEVERTRPEAVAEGPDGIKEVNYSLATAGPDGVPALTGPIGLGSVRKGSLNTSPIEITKNGWREVKAPARRGLAHHRKKAA